jgi:hypothetical protein
VSRRAWLIGVVPLLLMQPEGALGRYPLPEIVGMSGRENPKAPVETSHAPLTLLARPTFMLRRGDIRIEVRVLRHADNRRLAIAWTPMSAAPARHNGRSTARTGRYCTC